MTTEQKGTSAPAPFKKKGLYYSFLAIIAVVVLVISFVTYYFVPASTSTSINVDTAYANAKTLASGERNSYETNSIKNSVGTIKGWLNNAGISEVKATKYNESATITSIDQKFDTVSVSAPSYTVQDFEALEFGLDVDTVTDMTGGEYAGTEGVVYTTDEIKNIIVTIPGKGDDAVLFMTHYDSNLGSVNASSASAVTAMIGAIETLKGGTYENDLVFVITCGRHESSIGAYAFKNQFVGFDDVYSRVKVAFNFDAITADGALTIAQSTDGDSDVMSGYIASSACVKADTAVTSLLESKVSSDFDVFYDKVDEDWSIPALNFMMASGSCDAGSEQDNFNVVSESAVAQYASAIEGLAKYFGSAKIANMKTGGIDGAGVSFLGVNVGMSGIAVYILSALLLLLLVGNLVLGNKKKAFSIIETVKGLGGVLLSLALSLGVFFGAYFLVGLLSVGFGAISMNMLFGAHLMTPAVLVPAILFALAVLCGLYPAIKRGFRVKATDVVRGGVVLQMLVAIAFGFIFPAGSLAFLLVGVLNGVIMLLTTLLKVSFKNKFGFAMDRLMLYTLPAMLGTAMLVQTTMMIGNLVATISVPFLLVAISLMLSTIAPYFDYLKPVLSDAFYKLPKHTIRVIETVVEDKEDEIKKGKFETVTETRLVKRKVSWTYHNWFGVTALCVITALALFIATPISAILNVNNSINVMNTYDFANVNITDSFYDNSLVCVVDATSSNPGRFYWEIKDEAVYQKIKKVEGFDYYEWTYVENSEMYRMSIATASMPSYNESPGLFTKDSGAEEGYVIIGVNPSNRLSSQVKMTINGVQAGNELTVEKDDEVVYSIVFDAPAEKIDVTLPYAIGECEVKIKTDATLTVSGYEYVKNPQALNYAGEQFDKIKQTLEEKGIEGINVSYIIIDNL
ncbi:MAG: M28 family peptidase [Clostridia bacterium]|nr:M28 family peptidase [Clostridia bacterium]